MMDHQITLFCPCCFPCPWTATLASTATASQRVGRNGGALRCDALWGWSRQSELLELHVSFLVLAKKVSDGVKEASNTSTLHELDMPGGVQQKDNFKCKITH